jgi:hypothetical protein
MDSEKLMEYLSQFSSNRRDDIFNEIVGGKHLKKTLATKEGKSLLGSTVDALTNSATEMVMFCCDHKMTPKNLEALKEMAFELNANMNLMRKWAVAIATSERHLEEAGIESK